MIARTSPASLVACLVVRARSAFNTGSTKSRVATSLAVLFAGLLGLFSTSCRTATTAESTRLSVAAFSCDVTPPPGHPLCGGWIKPLVAVNDPLLAKGIVLSDGRTRYVICAVDWCLLQTGAHDLFRRKLAIAAEVQASHVAVQTVHQHNAPIADVNAQLLLDQAPSAPPHLDLKFMEEVTDHVATAVRQARTQMRPFTHVGWAKPRSSSSRRAGACGWPTARSTSATAPRRSRRCKRRPRA